MLNNIVKLWLAKIRLGAEYKRSAFSETAETIEKFYNRPHDFVYGGSFRGSKYFLISPSSGNIPQPTFKMTVNKTAEWVGIMSPSIYHRNPFRIVTPRRPNIEFSDLGIQSDQTDERRDVISRLLQWYLNFTPNELDLRNEARFALKDALIAGRGILWTELQQTPTGQMVGSFHESWRNLFLDPDASKVREAKWAVRRKIWPTWQFERHYGLPKGTVSPNMGAESYQKQSQVTSMYDLPGDERKEGRTNDLVEFFEVYSRMGLGGLASGADDTLRKKSESLGHNIFLVVCDCLEYPANLPPSVVNSPDTTDDEILRRISWPSPHWMDPVHPWPFACLDFMDDALWPVPPLAPALGEQIFIDWAYSFLASHVRSASRTVIAVNQAFQEEVEEAMADGGDETFMRLKLRGNDRLTDAISFITHPGINTDFFGTLQAVENNWDKRTGLNELYYGTTQRQMRSASEAQLRSQSMAIRPDEMSNRFEDFMSLDARNEAIMCRALLQPSDVAPVFGERVGLTPEGQPDETTFGPYTKLWGAMVHSTDMASIISELDFRIEAGSAKKPNLMLDRETIDNIMPVVMPMLQQYYFTIGDPGPINAFLRKWAESRNYSNWQDFLLPDLHPQGQPGQGQQEGGSRGEQRAAAPVQSNGQAGNQSPVG